MAAVVYHNKGMKPALLMITGALLLSSANLGAVTAPSAETLLSKAKAQAGAEHKSIFLMFDASW
jgi:hypothetical protein